MKCLHKDPHRRDASADELAADLERWLRGQPIHARPVTVRERLVRWVRRRPALTAMVGVCIAALAGLIVGLLMYNHDIGSALAETEELRKEGLKREAILKKHLHIADCARPGRHVDSGEDSRELSSCSAVTFQLRRRTRTRGFAWHHMDAMCRYEPQVLGKHDAPLHCLAVSPDDRWLATGDDKGVIKIWDLATQKEVRAGRADARHHAGNVLCRQQTPRCRGQPGMASLSVGRRYVEGTISVRGLFLQCAQRGLFSR